MSKNKFLEKMGLSEAELVQRFPKIKEISEDGLRGLCDEDICQARHSLSFEQALEQFKENGEIVFSGITGFTMKDGEVQEIEGNSIEEILKKLLS